MILTSSPGPGSIRLPDIPNNISKMMIVRGGALGSLHVSYLLAGKRKTLRLYIHHKPWKAGKGGPTVPKERAPKQLWLTACLQLTNRICSKIRTCSQTPICMFGESRLRRGKAGTTSPYHSICNSLPPSRQLCKSTEQRTCFLLLSLFATQGQRVPWPLGLWSGGPWPPAF